MGVVAPTNREAADAWGGVLFDRWLQFRDIVTTQLAGFSDAAIELFPPGADTRVIDLGCGLGDTTLRLADEVGPGGSAFGVDVGERFIEAAKAEAEEAGASKVSYAVADVQVGELGEGFDYAFSRFGLMFFAAPVPALRNIRSALAPGGQLVMIVWRRKLDNDWLHRGELVVERYLAEPEETDEPTCGPGPFSMANADTVTEQLVHAGYEEITLRRCDLDYRMGDDLDGAIALVTAIGPAGELIRLAGDEAEKIRPQIEAELREAYAELARPDGVFAQASAWIISARAPA